jgi:cell division cycle 2-like protein
MDFIDHDLRGLMDEMSAPFTLSQVKTLLKQLLSAMETMHDRWIIHRDLKTSNLLLSNQGEIKVADFGLARKLGEPHRGKLTPVVVTLWYRAPELLLGATEYGWEVDVWSAGCIFAELLSGRPIFAGKTEPDQIHRIFSVLGMPNERSWPGFSALPHAAKISPVQQPFNTLHTLFPSLSPSGLDLMKRMLAYDPKTRISASEALAHKFFTEAPLPQDPSLFPSWPSKGAGEKYVHVTIRNVMKSIVGNEERHHQHHNLIDSRMKFNQYLIKICSICVKWV